MVKLTARDKWLCLNKKPLESAWLGHEKKSFHTDCCLVTMTSTTLWRHTSHIAPALERLPVYTEERCFKEESSLWKDRNWFQLITFNLTEKINRMLKFNYKSMTESLKYCSGCLITDSVNIFTANIHCWTLFIFVTFACMLQEGLRL